MEEFKVTLTVTFGKFRNKNVNKKIEVTEGSWTEMVNELYGSETVGNMLNKQYYIKGMKL